MAIALEDVTVPRQILLVEDEKIARDNLARMLRNRQYEVMLADSGSGAILQARRGAIGVVLMDIELGESGEMDGIDAAREIQLDHPLTSFIFVTAYARDPVYRESARRARIRIGGWIEKPTKVNELVVLIEKELEKLKVLAWIEEVRGFGGDLTTFLDQLADTLPPEVHEALLDELQAGRDDELLDEGEEIRPLEGDKEEVFMEIAAEIDSVYSRIRDLVAQNQGGPGFGDSFRSLRARLESLQEQEAEAMERQFRSRLQFDPQQGRQILQRGRSLLRRGQG